MTLIMQGFASIPAGGAITQGYAQAPAPSGGTTSGGSATPLARFSSITYRYLGGRSGQPEPSCLPAGPILVRYVDEYGATLVDVMQAVQQDPDPPGATINPGAIGWEQIIAWCPLSELNL